MLILTIRTDNPTAELGLFDNEVQVAYQTWEAHRQLAETIHLQIKELLDYKQLGDVRGIVFFVGPGSFTGLRIGASVANAFASGLRIPIVGAKDADWIKVGIEKLVAGQNDHLVMPEYGAPVHITQPKK